MHEYLLTEERVMEEVQRACEPIFFKERQVALQNKARAYIAFVCKTSIETLDILFLGLDDGASLSHREVRALYMNHWWQRWIPGRRRAMTELKTMIEEDRISRMVFQAIHRILDPETSAGE